LPVDSTPTPRLYERLRGYAIVAVLLVLCAVAWVRNPNFGTIGNLSNIVVQVAPVAISAYGMTFVMVAGGFDLSVGSIAAMAGMVAASLIARGTGGTLLGVAAGLGVGCLLGLANGVLIARARVNPFVATLGSMLMIRSLVTVFSGGGKPITLAQDSPIGQLSWGKLLGVPNPIWLVALGVGLAWLVLVRTPLGRSCYALGGNKRAAWLSGVRTAGLEQLTYVIAGGCAAAAGLLMMSRVTQADATAGTGHELDVIAAVIIGGTPLGGGAGNPLGTLVGVLALGVINNLLVFLHVDPSLQQMAKGAIIVAAVALDSVYGERREQAAD